MSTTAQQIYVRARQMNPANVPLAPTPAEILARIEADQQALFAEMSGGTRDRFQTTNILASTGGSSARTFDLSASVPPVERILQLNLADGREARQVDVLDIEAELSPRYIVRGQTLVEVSNDWSSTAGAVTATLIYVYGPTSISPTGDYSQTITIPDAWADVLVLPLALYFASQRASAPGDAALAPKLQERTAAFAAYLENYGGVESSRFIQPTPSNSGKK